MIGLGLGRGWYDGLGGPYSRRWPPPDGGGRRSNRGRSDRRGGPPDAWPSGSGLPLGPRLPCRPCLARRPGVPFGPAAPLRPAAVRRRGPLGLPSSAAWPDSSGLPWRPAGHPRVPRRDHRQRDPAPLLVHLQHPDLDDVADGNHLVRVADEAVGHVADVDQPAVVHADVDKGPEIDDVEHGAGQLHRRRQVFQLQHAPLEDRRRQVLAGIAPRPGQLGDDVLEQQRRPPRGPWPGRRRRSSRAARPAPPPSPCPPGRPACRRAWPAPCRRSRSSPGWIQVASSGLSPSIFRKPAAWTNVASPKPGTSFNCCRLRNGPCSQAVFVQPPGGQLVQAGDVAQQRRAGRVDVHADVVDARLDHLVERLVEVLGLDVVLVEADAEIGRARS